MIDILRQTAEFVLLAYVPGALLFRLPIAERGRRAALAADERAFWSVMLSVAWSLGAGLSLAVAGRYSFRHLLFVNGFVSLALLLWGHRRLLYGGSSARVTWRALLPIALIALGLWRFFPPSEYIIGGKDPGTYMNEGIQIAQRGTVAYHDPVVVGVPSSARSLFFPWNERTNNSGRFMGFFVQDLATGTVIGQFPHLFPTAIAIGHGLNGLSGARETVGMLAILGVLAVYFAAARLVGPVAAFSAGALLTMHVIEVWFARYPNSEVLMQALLFGALLAFARAHQDGDRFFAPISGTLLALLFFLRIDALLAVAIVGATAVLLFVVDRRATPRLGFIAPLVIGLGLGCWYYSAILGAYMVEYEGYFGNLPHRLIAAAVVGAVIATSLLFGLRARFAARTKTIVPALITAAMLALAAYAWFFRHPAGLLTDYDAYALRTFVNFYLFWPGLVAALVGLVLLTRRDFWRDPAFIMIVVVFSAVFFYKVRIVPVHFWMTRRFLAVVLPGALVLIATAALSTLRGPLRGWRVVRPALGVIFLVLLGQQYLKAAAPVMPHVEYAGIIPYLEKLAGQFGDRDLVLVESRDAGSDVHVLGLPLADIYARNVLVLASARPDKRLLQAFIEDALTRYDHVYFLGGGGTDLLSRSIFADPVFGDRVGVPEYDSSPWDVYPSGIRRKDVEYSIYRLSVGARPHADFALDIGTRDDLNVVRFYAKEQTDGRSIRWTGRASEIEIPGMTGRERDVSLTMKSGGRPPTAPAARVEVFFNGVSLGTIDVGTDFQVYHLALPGPAAIAAGAAEDPARLRLVSTVWNPRDLHVSADSRDLGVMVARVEVH